MSEEGDSITKTPSPESLVLDQSFPRHAIAMLKQSRRNRVLEGLSVLLEQALERSLSKKLDVRQQQKWFTIAAYLAQVMARIVRDLDFEKLRAEVDELKRQMDLADVDNAASYLAAEGRKATTDAITGTSQDQTNEGNTC